MKTGISLKDIPCIKSTYNYKEKHQIIITIYGSANIKYYLNLKIVRKNNKYLTTFEYYTILN